MRATSLVLTLFAGLAFGTLTCIQRAATTMEQSLIRDYCQWRHCREESDMVYLGAGLCDEHWVQACEVYKDTTEYVLSRVNAQAAQEIRAHSAQGGNQ